MNEVMFGNVYPGSLLAGPGSGGIKDDRGSEINPRVFTESGLLIREAGYYLSYAEDLDEKGKTFWILLENSVVDFYSVFTKDRKSSGRKVSTPIVAVELRDQPFLVTFVGDDNQSFYVPKFHIPDGKKNPVVGDECYIREFFVGELNEKIAFI